ncbi:MAG: 50S ribosomal protein L24 [bacterium]|nr:50S ribosomal protein L24 [bacterium]
MKIKKGDQVKIVSGKDNGKAGKVVKVIPKSERAIVEGLNLVKKHVRPRRAGEKGQIIEVPRSIHISSVMFVCSKCGKPTRIGYMIREGKKYRICKRCRNEI